MPIQVERFAIGLYCQHWTGEVISSDLQKVGDEISVLADADHVEHYVVMIDATCIKKFPFNLRAYMGSVKPRNAAILVLNAPFGGEVLGQMFNKLMPIRVNFFRDREKWLAEGNAILAQASGSPQGDPSA